MILRNDDAGTGMLVDNLLTQYKMVNASLVPSALNVFVDGSLQLSNVPYTGVSTYQRTTAGTHTFSIEATTTPGASLLTLAPNLAAATDTSIVLTGTAGALNALVLADNNLPPPAATANVRFVNSSADVAAFDVFINFSKQISGLSANSASSYFNLSAAASTGTSYEFDFNLAGTTTSLLKLHLRGAHCGPYLHDLSCRSGKQPARHRVAGQLTDRADAPQSALRAARPVPRAGPVAMPQRNVGPGGQQAARRG